MIKDYILSVSGHSDLRNAEEWNGWEEPCNIILFVYHSTTLGNIRARLSRGFKCRDDLEMELWAENGKRIFMQMLSSYLIIELIHF